MTSYLLLKNQTWYEPYTVDYQFKDPDVVEPSLENTVKIWLIFQSVYLVSFMQYIITGIAFSISKPFKKEIQSNYLLCGFLAFSVLFTYYMILANNPILANIFTVTILSFTKLNF